MKDISRTALNAVLDEMKANAEGAALARVCERPLERDAAGDIVSAKTVEIIDRLLTGFLNHPGTGSEARALVAMARARLHAAMETPPPALTGRAPRARAEPAVMRAPPHVPETGPKVSADRLHALIARGLRVLAGTTNVEPPANAGAREKTASGKPPSRESGVASDGRAGMLDRRSLLKLIKTESDRANRYTHPLSLALIAICDLEAIRAERGVPVRDAVLRAYVRYMQGGFRSCDVIARIATNQFVVVLPHTDGAGANGALEKLRAAMRGASVAVGHDRLDLPDFAGKALTYREREGADQYLARARALLNVLSAQGRRATDNHPTP